MRNLKIHFLLILLATFWGVLPSGTASLFAGGKWSVNGNVQFTRGNYTFETSTSIYYLYGGIRYRTSRWSLSATMPVIAQNSDLVTSSGGGSLPAMDHGNEGSSGSHHGGGMNGEGMSSFMEAGLGDFYLYGEYGLLTEQAVLPFVSATLKLKVPTAGTGNNFGTGEFDYGLGFVLRKSISMYIGFVDLGYWFLGDPPGASYKDPFTFGAGVGRFLGYGRYALMLYYGSYSNILPEYESNRQISLGLNYRINTQLIFTVISGAGLSETSPDFILSSGLEWSL
jgi:hypothetical protein